MKAYLQNPIFNDVNKARKWLEGHLWADGPVCSHCGTVNNGTALDTRPGLTNAMSPLAASSSR
jgi:hypothetical protein